MISGLGQMMYEMRQRELGLLSLEKVVGWGGCWGDLATAFTCNYLMGGWINSGASLYSKLHNKRARGNGHKLKQEKF